MFWWSNAKCHRGFSFLSQGCRSSCLATGFLCSYSARFLLFWHSNEYLPYLIQGQPCGVMVIKKVLGLNPGACSPCVCLRLLSYSIRPKTSKTGVKLIDFKLTVGCLSLYVGPWTCQGRYSASDLQEKQNDHLRNRFSFFFLEGKAYRQWMDGKSIHKECIKILLCDHRLVVAQPVSLLVVLRYVC